MERKKYGSAVCFANFFVIAFIPTLFTLLVTMGFVGILPLNIPLHGLGIIWFIWFVFLLFVPHNANYSICKIRSSYLTLDSELRIALKKRLLRIGSQQKSLMNIEKFLQEYYKDVRNDNFASVASSIFPMLGILGTFVSIAISMPDFSVSDSASLNHEISLLLNGVGSAFYASIYGILLSLVWTYFEKRGLSKIEKHAKKIVEEYAPLLWSSEELEIHKYSQMAQQNQNPLAELTTKQQELFEAHANKILQVTQELSHTLTQLHSEKSALEAQKSIEESLKHFTTATQKFEKTIESGFTKIDAEVAEIVIKLADFATHVSLESQSVADSIAKYHALVADASKKES